MAEVVAERSKIITKALVFTTERVDQGVFYRAIQQTLKSLIESDFEELTVIDPLYIELSDGRVERARTFKKNTPYTPLNQIKGAAEQVAFLYVPDIARVVIGVADYLESKSTTDLKLNSDTTYKLLKEYLQPYDKEGELLLGKERQDLEEFIHHLIEIISEKLGPEASAEATTSLQPVIKELKTPEKNFLRHWHELIEPLLEAGLKLEKNSVAITHPKTQERYSIVELRVLLHHFVGTALKELTKRDTDNPLNYYKATHFLPDATKNISLSLLLSRDEMQRLAGTSTQGVGILFPEDEDPASRALGGWELLREVDKILLRNLYTFLVNDGVMGRLLGEIEVKINDAQTEVTDNDEEAKDGDADEKTDEQKHEEWLNNQKGALIDPQELLKEVLSTAQAQLNINAALELYATPLSRADKNALRYSVNEFLAFSLKSTLPNPVIRQIAQSLKVVVDKNLTIWDDKADQIINTQDNKPALIELLPALVVFFLTGLQESRGVSQPADLATVLITEALSARQQTVPDPDQIERDAASAQQAIDAAAQNQKASGATGQQPLSNTLQALVKEYRQQTGTNDQTAVETSTLRDYWLGLSIEKRVALYRTMQQRAADSFFVDFVFSEYLRAHGISDLQLKDIEQEFRDKFAQHIFANLTLDQVLLIASNDRSFLQTLSQRLINEYYSQEPGQLPFAAELKSLIKNKLDNKKIGILDEINKKTGIEPLQFAGAALTIDSLLLMFPDPISFIDGIKLEGERPEELLSLIFGLEFPISLDELAKKQGTTKLELLTFLKRKLKQYYQLRYQELLQDTKELKLDEPLYGQAGDEASKDPASFIRDIRAVNQLQLNLRNKALGMGAKDNTLATLWGLGALDPNFDQDFDIDERKKAYLKFREEVRTSLAKSLVDEVKAQELQDNAEALAQFNAHATLRASISQSTKVGGSTGQTDQLEAAAAAAAKQSAFRKFLNRFQQQQQQATQAAVQESAAQKVQRAASAVKNGFKQVKLITRVAQIASAIGSAIAAAFAALTAFLTAILGPFGPIAAAILGGVAVGVVVSKLLEAIGNLMKSLEVGGAALPTAAGQAGAEATAVSTAPGASTAIPFGPALPVLGTVGLTFASMALITMTAQNAFIDPEGPTLEEAGELSKYVSVSKLADQDAFQNSVSPKKVTYTITFTPKQNLTLTNVNAPASSETGGQPYTLQIKNVTDTFTNLGKAENGTAVDLVSPLSISQMPAGPVSSPQVFTYELDLGASADVMVNNTVEFTFDVIGPNGSILAADETIKATASVRVGEPVLGCFEFLDSGQIYDGGSKPTNAWSEPDKERILQAYLLRAGSNPTFNKLVCEDGPIKMYRISDAGTQGVVDGFYYGGVKVGLDGLAFYNASFNYSLTSLEYTLIHELGHILDVRNPELLPDFLTIYTPGNPNKPCFTYPLAEECNDKEAFAESVALFVVFRNYRFRDGEFDFYDLERAEHDWIQDNIYGGATF